MNCFKKIALITVLLSLSSCGWWPVASVRLYNEMPVPVNVSYMYPMGYDLDHSNDLRDMDTVYHTINPGKKLKLKFEGFDTKMFASDSSYFEFLKLETPTKSVYFKGLEEVRKVIRERKFIITDSLFNCRNKH